MLEIERKFLVNADELINIDTYEQKKVSQGYLSSKPEVRIRLLDDKCYLTKKGDGTLSREEDEEEISLATFKILYSLIQGRIINKTRVYIPLGENRAELDIYHDELEGLMTVEVEFSSIEDANNFDAPSWFGKDITEDKRFKNKALALNDVSLDELLEQDVKMRSLTE